MSNVTGLEIFIKELDDDVRLEVYYNFCPGQRGSRWSEPFPPDIEVECIIRYFDDGKFEEINAKDLFMTDNAFKDFLFTHLEQQSH